MGWFGGEQEIYLDAKKFVISLTENNMSVYTTWPSNEAWKLRWEKNIELYLGIRNISLIFQWMCNYFFIIITDTSISLRYKVIAL